MREWLPNNFEIRPEAAGMTARKAIARGKARRRNEKIAFSTLGFFFVAVMSFYSINYVMVKGGSEAVAESGGLALNQPQAPERAISPSETVQVPAASETAASKSAAVPSAGRPAPQELTINKVDHSVEISWEGRGKYAVYKCESPRFDTCNFMDVVDGNTYLDKEQNSATIVYYRVEPLTKG